jgi:hypothetical protein
MSAYLQKLGCPTVPPCCRDSPRYGKPQTVVEVELDLTKDKKLNDAVNRGAHFDNFMLKSYGPGHLFVKLHAGILTVIATKCFDRYKVRRLTRISSTSSNWSLTYSNVILVRFGSWLPPAPNHLHEA